MDGWKVMGEVDTSSSSFISDASSRVPMLSCVAKGKKGHGNESLMQRTHYVKWMDDICVRAHQM